MTGILTPQKHELLTEYIASDFAATRILELEQDGWRLLFTLPTIRIPHTKRIDYNIYDSTNQLIGINPDGTYRHISHYPPPADEFGYVDSLQIVMVKKTWESDPCPRCNHPYPDDSRIDRDI